MALVRSDFAYTLPVDLIAQTPAARRPDSRLLVLDPATDRIVHDRFADLGRWLEPGDLLVLNDTRVLPARLYARKDSGGDAELLLERIESPCTALFQVRVSKALQRGRTLSLLDGSGAPLSPPVEVLGRDGALYRLRFPGPVADWLRRYGQVPLPPYIDRSATADDRHRYQTVYARADGAVAAPTAGLHFDAAMLDALRAQGIETTTVTLHVGAGTFQPMRVDDLSAHHMHREQIRLTETGVAAIGRCRARRGRVVAVGTTAVRVLEAAAQAHGGAVAPIDGETDIFIYPGFSFAVVDALLTNFHLPESTLLMLVAAFAGRQRVLAAYREAIRARYRFFSYGDAMFITGRAAADAI